MFAGTKLPTEGETFTVPLKAPATGRIDMWFYEAGGKLAGEDIIIDEGADLCAIEVEVNGFPRLKFVTAPVSGKLVKIIKGEREFVREGETIGEMEPLIVHIVPPEIPPELYPFIG